MGKLIDTQTLDALFDDLIANGNELVCCQDEPTSYTEAHTTYMLANVGLAGGDYAKANETSGRKCTVAEKNAVSVTNTGTANWICITDTVNSRLKAKTTCTALALTAGGTVDFPSWVIHNPEPV